MTRRINHYNSNAMNHTMKSQRIIIWTSFLLVAGVLTVAAGDKKETSEAQVTKVSKTEIADSSAVVTLKNQTHCPIMGGEIDSAAYTDIQGQRVYHCCPGCSDELNTNPDKYFKKTAEEGILFENIQKSCPVSAMKLNDSVYTDYVGRRVYFGSVECRDTFSEEPTKYLSKLMDAPVTESESKIKKTTEDMSGHKHKKSDG